MHVDTGHNFPEVIEFRDRLRRRARRAADRRLRAGVDRRGPRGRGDRPARVAQPAADDDAARRDRGARLRRRLRRRPPRRGARPGEGAHLLASATTSASGTRRRQRPELWNLYNGARPPRRARARVPALQLDRARRVAVHRRGELELPVDLLRPRARGVPPRRDALRDAPTSSSCCDGEEPFTESRALPHRRRHELHGRGRARRATTLDEVVAEIAATRITERGETRADDRVSEAAMEDRKVRGLLLTARPATATAVRPCASDLLRLATAGSVDDGKSTLIGRLLTTPSRSSPTSSSTSRRPPAARRRLRSTSRCSPTACAPSASRASRSTSPTATSRRRGASSSSPTRPATSSTRATWSRAPRPPTSRSCWSTRATACVEQIAPPRLHRGAAAHPAPGRRVNKMDLVDYDEAVFDADRRRLHARSRAKLDVRDVAFIPISRAAAATTSSSAPTKMPWYEGPPLLYHLEHVHDRGRPQPRGRALPGAVGDPPDADERHDYRGYAGRGRRRRLPAGRRGASCCRAGSTTRIAGDRHLRRRARRGLPAAVA